MEGDSDNEDDIDQHKNPLPDDNLQESIAIGHGHEALSVSLSIDNLRINAKRPVPKCPLFRGLSVFSSKLLIRIIEIVILISHTYPSHACTYMTVVKP